MTAKGATVALGLGAVFLAAFAATQVAQRPTQTVGWTEMGEGPGGAAPAPASVGDLQAQIHEIQRQLPGAPALALARLEVPGAAEFCGHPLPLDRPEVREALAYELLLTAGRPMMPMLWMRRSPRVLPMIEEKLAAAGLPDDLKYVAMIESDLRETVRSPAGAEGLWQFMRGTARRYGLRVDRYLDQRRSPEVATDAAIAYLRDLEEEFGDWFLALAAYNSGEQTVRRALEDAGTDDYFSLYLPAETRRYVPRLVAAKIITSSPEAYGLVRLAPYNNPRYRIVEVRVQRSRADLRKLAAEHGLNYAALRLANPQVRSSWLPRGVHRLRVPLASRATGPGTAEDHGAP
ncbi:MAG: lytic transglycosylase domain-containing protein [Acidobacteriota bacterium]|nr:lytic transglycosylase domain-containing protein [Acidobacteriota bacterium]MDQ7087619.1 lytic transglycosylase domain-containing protein [Acidobacteriota bacterium]